MRYDLKLSFIFDLFLQKLIFYSKYFYRYKLQFNVSLNVLYEKK